MDAPSGQVTPSRQVTPLSREFFTFLDASRWIAAFFVVISHVRHLLLVDYTKAKDPSLLFKAIYFLTGLGNEAVVIFFVISGFLVGGLTLDKWQRVGPAPLEYVTARVARIYTVLVPALMVCMLLDLAGAKWLDGAHLYSQPARYHTVSLFGAISEQLDFATLLGNLAMLQTIAVPVLGSNGPLWSLAYEWWYYCAFFAAAMVIVEPTLKRGVVCILVLGGLGWLLPGKLILMGAIWLLGVVIFFLARRSPWRIHPIVGLAVFLAAVAWSRLSHNADNLDHPESLLISMRRDTVLALGFASVIYCMAGAPIKLSLARIHRMAADFSYSTYLVHFPMLVFVVALLNQFFGIGFIRQPGIASLLYMIALTLYLYAFTYAFSLLSERYTERTRNWLKSRWRSDLPAPHPMTEGPGSRSLAKKNE